jgi:hypothetical protein
LGDFSPNHLATLPRTNPVITELLLKLRKKRFPELYGTPPTVAARLENSRLPQQSPKASKIDCFDTVQPQRRRNIFFRNKKNRFLYLVKISPWRRGIVVIASAAETESREIKSPPGCKFFRSRYVAVAAVTT